MGTCVVDVSIIHTHVTDVMGTCVIDVLIIHSHVSETLWGHVLLVSWSLASLFSTNMAISESQACAVDVLIIQTHA